jgi:hypothetical protein
MPKDAARIWLLITKIRVERLQDISQDDAIAEGIEQIYLKPFFRAWWKDYIIEQNQLDNPKWSFYTLWCKINGVESWNDNPWLWVIEFERIEKP